MSPFHLLTAVLVVLKLLGYIAIPWWGVLLPSIILFGIGFFIIALVLLLGAITSIFDK